jgi:hypothetical protein
MPDRIVAGCIVVFIFFLLLWRAWRVMTGRSSGCGCGKGTCPMLNDDDGAESTMCHAESCRSGMIVADLSESDEEKEQEDV